MSETVQTASNGFSQSNKKALHNPWVIGWLTAVFLVLAVNVGMISLAFITSPGLVTADYYEKGQDWEKTIATRIAARSALGWELKLDTPELRQVGRPAAYRLVAVDKVGVPLTDANVTLRAYRPSDAEADFLVDLKEVGPGIYEAPINFPLKGIWDLKVSIKRGEDQHGLSRRISVRG